MNLRTWAQETDQARQSFAGALTSDHLEDLLGARNPEESEVTMML